MSTVAEDEPARRELLSKISQTFAPQFDQADPRSVRNIHVPVFGPDGRVGVVLTVGGFPPLDGRRLTGLISDVRSVAERIGTLTGGSPPDVVHEP